MSFDGRALRGARTLAMMALVATSIGCGDDDKKDSTPEERVVYSEGRTVHLAKYANGALTDVSSASLPTAGLLEGHTIFSVVKHPTQNLLYVSSFNECYSAGDWCWGNARIDIFKVSKSAISYQGPAFIYDATATGAACALEDPGITGQVGYCAPVNGTFSPNGQRFYVQEDDNDLLHIFSVGTNGTLTLLDEGPNGGLDLHGLAYSPTQPYLYNGSGVINVTGDVPVQVTPGSGGNYTALVDMPTGADMLITTLNTNGVGLYSLADPAVPAELDTYTFAASNTARSVRYDIAHSRLLVVGRNSVATLGFASNTITPADTDDNHVGSVNRENRSVVLIGDGTAAAVAWFELSDANPSGFVGGVTVYTIATDGTLTKGGTATTARSARAVTTVNVP